jgi:hypothetical protein
MTPRRRPLAIVAVAAVLLYAGVHSAGHPGHSTGSGGKLGICLVFAALLAAAVRLVPRGGAVRGRQRSAVPADDLLAKPKGPYLTLALRPARLQRFRN